MSHSSEEETDMSESELEVYAQQCYEELRDGKEKVKISNEIYECPFCRNGKVREYHLKDLYQHACGVGNGSKKRKVKDKGKHSGLVKYLDIELAGKDRSVKLHEMASDFDKNEEFVYPWRGILANIPIDKRGGSNVGESGSRIRDDLIRKGFNPLKVEPLWNRMGFSGYAIVEFSKGWPGFSNAMSFEKFYEADHHGKEDYHAANHKGDKLYGWVARADDYNSSRITGNYLKKKGYLTTVADIEAEEKKKASMLVTNLAHEIEVKNKCLKEIECKYNETSISLSSMITENEKMAKLYNEEVQKMQDRARAEVEKIFEEHEKTKLQLQSQKEKLIQREKELEQREAKNENERQKFEIEKRMNAEATMEQKKAEKKFLKLVEEQKKEKENLHKKIIELEKQLDAKQALELEIECLRGAKQVMKHMEQDGDEQAKNQLLDIQCQLKEKEEELEDLDEMSQHLIVKERRSNVELQDARKELITGWTNKNSHVSIGIKRMGELDLQLFQKALKGMFSRKKVDEKAAELCSLWQDYLRDPNWHPLKVIKIPGSEKMQEIIDNDDEKLNGLKNEYGDQVYQIVVTALQEMNEYNPSGGYPVPELWNFKENRRARLKEGIQDILNLIKQHKRKRT